MSRCRIALTALALTFGISLVADAQQPVTSATLGSFYDALYDYEVHTANSTEGQTEYVIWAEFSDTGDWELVHRYVFMGSPDRGMSQSDRGVYTFTTWWSAFQHAENLMDDGEITDYGIYQQPVPPDFQYMATFDTRAQAEDYADLLEQWGASFGVPQVTKIVAKATYTFNARLR